MPKTVGQLLAADLPIKDEEDANGDLISLNDIVITGIEAVPWVHFRVQEYDPAATGEIGDAWARLLPLEDAQPDPKEHKQRHVPVSLTAEIMRFAVAKYVDSRIDGGMGLEEARKLMDGSYTDAPIADSILQFALYGEEIFG